MQKLISKLQFGERTTKDTVRLRTKRAVVLAIVVAVCSPLLLVSAARATALLSPLGSVSNAIATSSIVSADLHFAGAGELEVDLSFTQTQSNCGAVPKNQVCVRYGVQLDDQPVQMGYGLISASAIQVSGSTITLSINTTVSSSPSFTRVVGAGGVISLSWSKKSTGHNLSPASVQGSIMGYPVPSSGVIASVLTS